MITTRWRRACSPASPACGRRTGKAATSCGVVEVVAPFGGTDEMLKGLKAKMFKDRRSVSARQGRGEGDVMPLAPRQRRVGKVCGVND